jgi:hypothetical protein
VVGVVEGAGARAGLVVVGVVEGAGARAGLVVVGVVEDTEVVVEPDDACESDLVRAFLLRCGCFGVAFASPVPVACTARLLVVWLVTLVSEAATPDEYEPEACFDRMGVLEMDAGVAETDRNGISSGLGADPLGAPSEGAGLGETKCVAATAQITKASVVSVIMHTRTMSNGRSPQTGLIDFILTRIRIQHYPFFGGGRLL